MKRPPLKENIKTIAARRSKIVVALYVILRLIVAAMLVVNIVQREFETAFACALALVLFMMPTIVEHRLNIDLPNTLEVIVLLFIFAHEILGELGSYYITKPYWDTMLHITCGFLMAAVGFAMIDVLNQSSKIKFDLSPLFCAFAAFCFSMTIGVLWEFFEFAADRLFHMDMQKDTILNAIHSTYLDHTCTNIVIHISDITDISLNAQPLGLGGYLDIGLFDTMEDLFVNFIGAVVFSIIGYFYVKQKGRGKFAKRFIPTLNEDDVKNDELKYRSTAD